MYSVEKLRNGDISDRFTQHITYLSLEEAQNTKSDYHEKPEFINNPLVIARNSGTNNLSEYFDKAKSNDKVANWHRLNDINPTEPSGRLLFLSYVNLGLGGGNLGNNGRFIGVAPEAPS